jgi:hypothetical protein
LWVYSNIPCSRCNPRSSAKTSSAKSGRLRRVAGLRASSPVLDTMRHRSRRAIRSPSAYFSLMQLPPPELGTTLVAARKIPHGTMARGDWNEVGREREKVPPPIPADKRRLWPAPGFVDTRLS